MTQNNPLAQLQMLLAQQKQAYQAHSMPSASERIERLARLKQCLLKYQDDIVRAISQDYGHRSSMETKIGEFLTCLEHIRYYSKNLTAWMKPSKRSIGMLHQPAKAWVQYQPMGVVGIIAPWNYPLMLSVGPLICALAAGNHAMIKLSSASPHFTQVLQTALGEFFPPSLVSVVHHGDGVAEAFSHLAFDKLVFTGSTEVGKTVMKAAAENLVPVLLELGGKSPVIVHSSMDMKDVAQRVAFGKLWNAGQTCVAPDHIYLPKGKTVEFVQAFKEMVQTMYPTLKHNADYTAIIHQRQYDKLQQYLDDAQQKGAVLISINPNNEDLSSECKFIPTLVTHTNADMLLMQQEIFGPILPIIEYEHIDDVISAINQSSRPLALYYFDYDQHRAYDV
ncbi:MAG: aldehyde dehydrogenase family protein, partial [Acinetobacter sp.]|nr:aldehyde dehydrogenase family protein [Acinetobacter sp.]